MNACPLHWECKVLSTGPPGKSLDELFLTRVLRTVPGTYWGLCCICAWDFIDSGLLAGVPFWKAYWGKELHSVFFQVAYFTFRPCLSVRKSLEHVCYKLTKGLLHFESYLNSVPHWKESFQMGKNFVILNASEGNGLYGWRVQRCDFAEQGCLSHIACFYDVTVWAWEPGQPLDLSG